jgi:hypothetical protein
MTAKSGLTSVDEIFTMEVGVHARSLPIGSHASGPCRRSIACLRVPVPIDKLPLVNKVCFMSKMLACGCSGPDGSKRNAVLKTEKAAGFVPGGLFACHHDGWVQNSLQLSSFRAAAAPPPRPKAEAILAPSARAGDWAGRDAAVAAAGA